MTDNNKVRTRFAPSPTGYMHIGNLRTALYAYLFARANRGTFILRIEDTDQSRYVADAVDFIKRTLAAVDITIDEGPDIGGDYAPYIQSERLDIYKKYAEELVERGQAYYCFCQHHDNEAPPTANDNKNFGGYARTCRDLSPGEIKKRLANGEPYVIRQKMPLSGTTTYHDVIHGNITFPNEELEDQVLLKRDGMPTYNFANVIDDHLMKVTHVIRGAEFITSTPKHVQLYQNYGWELPVFVHLAPVMGRSEDGSVSKLSKRHGATSFEDLVNMGYLPAAIVNYIALLGWNPKTTNQEVFTMNELIELFSLEGLSKSPAVFDYDKLGWFSGEYFKAMKDEEFSELARPFAGELAPNVAENWPLLAKLLKTRTQKLSDISTEISFLSKLPAFDASLYENKRNKVSVKSACELLPLLLGILAEVAVSDWDNDSLYAMLDDFIASRELKKGTVMWVLRIAAAGKSVTPGGATEILTILGKEESLRRIELAINELKILLD